MNYGDAVRADKLHREAIQKLAGGGGSKPPIARAAAAPRSPEPTLTEKFNRATKGPVLHNGKSGPDYKKQIDLLRQQMSQPRNTLEMSPMGTVTRSINQQKDRWLMQSMTALTRQMSNDNRQERGVGLAARKGEAKRAFNQAAKGLGR